MATGTIAASPSIRSSRKKYHTDAFWRPSTHMRMDLDSTICALSSGAGRAGIAIIRISGQSAFEVLAGVFRAARGREPIARRAVLGRFIDPENEETIDEVLATRFPGPTSFTGEDVVEVSLHGSPVLVSRALEVMCRQGARLAQPGEFTLRAFLNGRMDLAQAEAVRDLIESTTSFQARIATQQRSGALSRKMVPIKRRLVDVIVQLESAIEFVEEKLQTWSKKEIVRDLSEIEERLRVWVGSYRKGRVVRDGFSLAIIGRPNAGKSSLFNVLLEQDRSIVTDAPGTTRDFITEYASIEGIPVRLLDTAGLRPVDDPAEKEGVQRSYEIIAEADALLLVVDRSMPNGEQDRQLRDRVKDLCGIVVMNKSDLQARWSPETIRGYAGDWDHVELSAKTGARIPDLRQRILEKLIGGPAADDGGLLITNLRHCQCLEGAQEALRQGLEALSSGLSEEFVLVDLHRSLQLLGQVTGETDVEDLLGEIFSRFCIGK